MARHALPIAESLAGELYNHFLDFIDEKQTIPNEHAFWNWLIYTEKYTAAALPVTTFKYHFGRLMREGFITIEPDTRSLIPHERRIVRLPDSPATDT